MSDVAISTKALGKSYRKTRAVDGLNLRVPRGSVYGLLGRNGAGKTTTIRMLMGLTRPSGGSFQVLDMRPHDQLAMLQRVAYVGERKLLFDSMTGRELLRFNKPFFAGWSAELANTCVQRLEIPLEQPFKKLSRGNQTKLCLLMAVSDIDFPHQKITIRPEVAKYRSGRVVFYGDATSDLLSAYVRCRKSLLMRRCDSLFVSESRRNSGSGLSFEMWNKIVRQIAERIGLPQFTTHTFRHLRLTDLARCKLELHEIATYAGHRNPKTTQQYVQLSGEELRERIQRATQHIDEQNRRLLKRIRGNDGKS